MITVSKFRLRIYPSKDYDVWFAGLPYSMQPKVLKTLDKWAADEKADEVYNLAMFNMTTGTDQYGPYYGRTIQYVRTITGDIGYGGTADKITLPNGCVCSGYKSAILAGVIQSGLTTAKNSRNANGITLAGDYFHIQASDCSEAEIANYCLGFVKTLLLQDGGGSVGRWTKAEYWRTEAERAVASVVCIKHKTVNPEPVIIEGVLSFATDAPNGGTQKDIDAIVLHHAATSATAKSVHASHQTVNGWWGIGYHYYIEKNSNVIWRGRPEKFVGSHAGSANTYNTHSIGLCAEGNFDNESISTDQARMFKWLVENIKSRYSIKEVIGHRDIAATSCPGKNFPLAEIAAVVPPKPTVIYRVQVGAFSKRENAEALVAKLKQSGFDGFITT